MREILFRGKGLNTGKWIEGFYVYHINRTPSPIGDELRLDDEEHLIVKDAFSDWNMPRGIDCYHVDPKTVGQYTGLKDRNGKGIFDGDIVECWGEGVKAQGAVQQRQDGLWIIYPAWQKSIMWGLCPNEYGHTSVEVIGNIHDNPELINGGTK